MSKLLVIILNVVITPLITVFLVQKFYLADLREAALFTLYMMTVGNVLALLVRIVKIVFKALTFKMFGALKESIEILVSLAILILYWSAYYSYWGANFHLSSAFWIF